MIIKINYLILAFFCYSYICLSEERDQKWLTVFSICHNEGKIKKDQEIEAYINIYEHFNSFHKNFVHCKKNEYLQWQKIIIKRRGNSSDYFSKKQYLLKFKDTYNKKQKISLLSLRKDSSWIINGPYVDRTFIRNALAYQIGNAISNNNFFAPNTKFIELYLNGNYRGLYVLTEKIKRNTEKVSISKIENTNNHTIPFIGEVSAGDGDFKTAHGTHIKYVYPEKEDIKEIETTDISSSLYIKNSIKANINKLEKILSNNENIDKIFSDENNSILNIESFINYILIQEIFKNIDGFRRSTYFYMNNHGIFHMGPLWDFNLSMGNLSFYDMEKTTGWLHKKRHIYHKHAFWFESLLKNKTFKKNFIAQYKKLRYHKNVLSYSAISTRIDNIISNLHDAYKRDYKKWENSYNFIEYFIFNTTPRTRNFEDNISILKNWLKKRLLWIDNNIDLI